MFLVDDKIANWLRGHEIDKEVEGEDDQSGYWDNGDAGSGNGSFAEFGGDCLIEVDYFEALSHVGQHLG